MEAGGRGVLNDSHANSTNAFSVRLRRHDNQSLVLNSPACNTFLGTAQVSSTSTQPDSRSRPDRTIARRILCSHDQTVR
jgi:hypothetical protein